MDAPAGDRLSDAPAAEPPGADGSRKRLTSRLFGLGAIPILVFCGMYLVASRIFGLDSPQGQAYTLVIGLAGAVASLFVLAFLASRAAVGEIDAVRDAVRHVAGGGEQHELPELTSPLEELKHEVLDLAHEMQSQQSKMQERLDTARQQIFFLTNHDALTGLPNRKALEERLESALASAKSQGATHALLYLDIDLFHRINDSFGHLAGDELLRRIAPILQSNLREGELLARIGGDEFAVLLPMTDERGAEAMRERILTLLEMNNQFHAGQSGHALSLAIGLATCHGDEPLEAALQRADRAMYEDKSRYYESVGTDRRQQ